MSPIEITFSTPTYPKFSWLDSLKSLKEEEIEELIMILRGALSAFSAELIDRRQPWRDQVFENYKEMLQETARQINKQGLTETHEKYLNSLKSFLAQAGCAYVEQKENKTSKAMVQYLLFFSKVIGWPYVLLIFCTLGKHKVEHLDEDQRVKLVKYIAQNRETLFCRRLQDKAIQCNLQNNDIKVNLPLTRGSKKRKRQESTDKAVSIELKNPTRMTLRSTATNERAISTDSSPFPPESVKFPKRQAEPQARAVLSTIQQWPYSIYKDEQPAASSTINPSDMLQPSTSIPKPTKQTCAVIPALRNLTSSAMSIYQNPVNPRDLSVNAFNDLVSEQESVTPAAHQVDHKDPASQDLATLLYFLGQSKISERLLERARGPLLAWGENGEVALRTINMIEVVQNQNLCEKAIYDLHQLRAIHLEPSTVKPRYISVNPQLLTQIAHDKDRVRWMSEAVKVVFYVFPMDRRLEPLYSFSIVTSMLPLLEHVLPFLEEIDIEKALPAAYVIEVCLSASYYSTLDWKRNLIAIAEDIGKRFSVSAQLSERIALRKMIVSRLWSCEWGSEAGRLDYIRVDPRSTGYYGDFVLFNANVLFERQQLQAALDELDRYTPWNPGNISTLEKIQICEISFLRGKIHHFSGHFKEARRLLSQILLAERPEASMTSKAIAHLTAVCCELGETRLGIDYASDQLNDIMDCQSRESGSAKRLKLALAYAYLMQGLWVIFNQPTASGYTSLLEDIQQGFDKARELLQVLVRSYENANILSRAGKINRLSTLLGLALIAHVNGDLHEAVRCYDIALNAAGDCKWDVGYIEAIIYWSKSVIMHSLGELDETRKFNGLAGRLYQCRSYFFTGFGTLWPEIIGTWVAQQGRERIIPQQGWERMTPS